MRDPDPPGGNPCGGGFSEGGRQHGYDHRRPCSDSVCGREKLGIVSKQSQCMTGEVLSGLSEDDLAGHLDEIRVFARVSRKIR